MEQEGNSEQQDIVSEVVASYNANISLNTISKITGYSASKIKKILVTAGVYTSETYDEIKFLREHGMCDNEIAIKVGLGKKAMNNYTPYKKGLYKLEDPSGNAKRIRKHRKKQLND